MFYKLLNNFRREFNVNQIYKEVYTLRNVISQYQNETELQFFWCVIQKALENHSNMFFVLHVFINKHGDEIIIR